MKNLLLLLTVFSVVVIGCKQANETKEAIKLGSELQKMGEEMEKGLEEGKNKMEARRAKGDTLPMHYDKLKEFLPKAIRDFTPDGDPKGQSMTMQAYSFSTTEQEYKSPDGSELNIILHDYNGLPQLYGMATMMLKSKMTYENDEQSVKTLNLGIDGVGAMETYGKKNKEAQLVIGVGERFFITMTAKKQNDTELLKTAAKAMPLGEMAEM
ncbi:MAG: hypothetical protein IPM47_00155 [Sphingobacteriales bacterium]|nr:MAG: hypothetical protein IPM47_00155 [Sphingobacteriales bacterium]